MADERPLLDLAAPLWTGPRVQQALGLDETTEATWRQHRRLLGLPASDSTDVFYPVAQFETVDGHVRVKPALVAFFQAAKGLDPWTVAVALETVAAELDGLTPNEWVARAGDQGPLMSLAQALSMELRRR